MADQKTLDLLLREARSHGDFSDRPVPEDALRAAHELMKWGPTSANCQPMRILYLRSREAREKLRPTLSATNLEKTMKAPLVALVAYDTRFFEHLPRMFYNPAAITWFKDKGAHTEITAFRNGTLQGGYFLLALRAVGLDCPTAGSSPTSWSTSATAMASCGRAIRASLSTRSAGSSDPWTIQRPESPSSPAATASRATSTCCPVPASPTSWPRRATSLQSPTPRCGSCRSADGKCSPRRSST
jgi:3-hydroxypropanoate dehydrogenase